MVRRCHDSTCLEYGRYGRLGIHVHKGWRDDFQKFLSDLGPCPEKHDLSRKNHRRGYEPGNCFWEERHAHRTKKRQPTGRTWLESPGVKGGPIG